MLETLLSHLDIKDSRRIVGLYATVGYGEVTKLLYRALFDAARIHAQVFSVTAEKIEIFENSELRRHAVIGPFESRLKTKMTFRKKLLQMLEVDEILASHLRVIRQNEDEVVCEIIYDIQSLENNEQD